MVLFRGKKDFERNIRDLDEIILILNDNVFNIE